MKDLKLFYEDTDGMRLYSGRGGLHQITPIDINLLKKIKALEIVKNKKVDVGFLNRELKDYNEGLLNKYKLTKEEYDLLQEVLLND